MIGSLELLGLNNKNFVRSIKSSRALPKAVILHRRSVRCLRFVVAVSTSIDLQVERQMLDVEGSKAKMEAIGTFCHETSYRGDEEAGYSR